MNKISCSVEILTRNSAATLERCLDSIKDFSEIIVLDGNSTDKTLNIAREYGAKIYKQYETDEPDVRIADFSEVRNKGLRLAQYDWFMFIDSDEYLSPEAVQEIRAIVGSSHPSAPNERGSPAGGGRTARAFWQPRKYVLNGKVIQCATTYPNKQIRFFWRGAATGFVKSIHERIDLEAGVRVGTLHGVEYVPLGSLHEMDQKWRRYRELEVSRYRDARPKKLLRLVFWHSLILLRVFSRYARNLFFCRGKKLPFRYEFIRHKHTAVYTGKLFILLIKRLL